MGTIDSSRFVVPTDQESIENFVCMVCLDVFVNPVVTQCCRQLFCYKCITDCLRKDRTCPKDKKLLDLKSLTPAPKLVTQFLDKLKVTCDYREEGCPLSLSLDKLKPHARVCEFGPRSSVDTINTFKTFVECHPCLSVNTLSPRSDFQILFKLPFDRERPPEPKPFVGLITTWDAFHVKMPNSIENRDHIRWLRENESPTFFNCTWHLIEESLNTEITCFEDFEKMVKSYNGKFRNNDFNVIYKLFQDNEWSNILESLNSIRKLALKLPYFFSDAVPHLRQGQNGTLMLSRQQIACLLANAFFSTFPRRTFSKHSNHEYKNFSTFNFASLFWGSQDTSFVKLEKLKCLVNYFNRVNEDFYHFAGVITFERRVLSNMIRPNWRNSDKKLTNLKVESTGTIDQDGKGFSQVDFAASSIGSNVLHGMCLREEILFLTHPELIVARLFTENLNDQESLIVTGCSQFNECLGYANSFKWSADKREELSLDGWGRPHRQFVLIDALEYRKRQTQYNFDKIERELNKAFCGFHDSGQYRLRVRPAIASGNWGCGAFNGDTYLKSLIQLLAASEAERDLILFTFNDNYTKNEVKRFYDIMRERQLSVKDIVRVMERHPFPNSESKFDFNYLSFLLTKFELSISPA